MSGRAQVVVEPARGKLGRKEAGTVSWRPRATGVDSESVEDFSRRAQAVARAKRVNKSAPSSHGKWNQALVADMLRQSGSAARVPYGTSSERAPRRARSADRRTHSLSRSNTEASRRSSSRSSRRKVARRGGPARVGERQRASTSGGSASIRLNVRARAGVATGLSCAPTKRRYRRRKRQRACKLACEAEQLNASARASAMAPAGRWLERAARSGAGV